VGDRPTDGAAVADLDVADERRGLADQGHGSRHLGAVLDRGVGGGRADPQRAVPALDSPQPVDAPHVDETIEERQPQGQHGDEALPAGQHLGSLAILREQ
jgi:hypothetical protein